MKRFVSLLIALALAVVQIPALAEGSMWTILVYLCGSDLESGSGLASSDVREMLASGIGDSEDINVLIATGGASSWERYDISGESVQYWRLGKSAPELLMDAGDVSMGASETLEDFLRYARAEAPADRYALILWDHGGGPVYGVCYDENHHDDALTISELEKGLASGLESAHLDVIAFDACLMNSVDALSAVMNWADYAVSSQEFVAGGGLDYDQWMKALMADTDMTAEALARLMAETYVRENSSPRFGDTVTMSAVDLSQMSAVNSAVEKFAEEFCRLLRENPSTALRARASVMSFGEFVGEDASDLVDILQLCDACEPILPDVSAALRAATERAVVWSGATGDLSQAAGGLSMFLPYKTAQYEAEAILERYSDLDSSYGELVREMVDARSDGYSFFSQAETPNDLYTYAEEAGLDGIFAFIWEGLFGASSEAFERQDDIWAGLPTTEPVQSSIWANLPTTEPAEIEDDIWAGLVQSGGEYYDAESENQNLVDGISDAVTPTEVMEAAQTYFSEDALAVQSLYTLQLTKDDLDHLISASGVLFLRGAEGRIRLGNVGETTIDWSTGLIYSMFDGAWTALEGELVSAEQLYTAEDGTDRFVIPALVNDLKMYLLAKRNPEGGAEVLGATQGYDENGFAIRGSVPISPGMAIIPLFTSEDGELVEGNPITVPESGLTLSWIALPSGQYEYCFGLTDLSGDVHYTQAVELSY